MLKIKNHFTIYHNEIRCFMAYRDYYNHYSFVKPSNEQYIVPYIQLKCKQNESLLKFDINFNNLKTNDNIHGTLYSCGNSKSDNFLKIKPDGKLQQI